jgi:uncharacterized protein
MSDASFISEATVATTMAARYMTQLCKHFEHKLPVKYGPADGRIEFATGICIMDAQGETLHLRAEAKDAESLGQLEHLVVRHLERFAFRDKPAINWTRATS